MSHRRWKFTRPPRYTHISFNRHGIPATIDRPHELVSAYKLSRSRVSDLWLSHWMICPSLSHGVAVEQHSTVSWRYLFTISYVYLTKNSHSQACASARPIPSSSSYVVSGLDDISAPAGLIETRSWPAPGPAMQCEHSKSGDRSACRGFLIRKTDCSRQSMKSWRLPLQQDISLYEVISLGVQFSTQNYITSGHKYRVLYVSTALLQVNHACWI